MSVAREEHARDGCKPGGNGKDCDLQLLYVLAERGGRQFVLSDRLERAPERRDGDAVQQPDAESRNHTAKEKERRGVPRKEREPHLGDLVAEYLRLRNVGNPESTIGQPRKVINHDEENGLQAD